ncbi:hypothetical protein UPYG_G00276740 [Umbra pygmaea]|uniref:C1q domain-containing protein n=1 Tax=Umbra pygmaea TaxID=75934 RepID=A0ABD0W3D5_UMBPY
MRTTVALLTLLCCHVLWAQQDQENEDGLGNDIFTQVHSREVEDQIHDVETQTQGGKAAVSSLRLPTNLSDLHDLLQEMNAELGRTQRMMEDLKSKNEDMRVAFSASLFPSGSGYMGPFSGNSHQTVLIFGHVFTNIGNAYDSNTGVFTAPVRGVYEFKLYLFSFSHTSHPVAARLVKNGQLILIAHQRQDNYEVNASNAASLMLEKGDTVNLTPIDTARIYDDTNHRCTFSGHLLFTM